MEMRTIKRIAWTGLVTVVGVTGFFLCTETVSQGKVGVVFDRMQGGVQEEVLTEGLHFVSPMARITEYPISTETVEYEFSLPTADTKTIAMSMVLDYQNDPDKVSDIYSEWRGQDSAALEQGYLKNSMMGIASEVVSKYTILDLNNNRAEIQAKIFDAFTKKVGEKGFNVSSIVLGKPSYDEQTEKAIQDVVNKQQELKALEIEKQKAEISAEKKMIEAKAEADANKTISSSITEELIKMKEPEARLKHGWVEVQTGQAIVDTNK
jgi:prohibitin 1